MTDAEDDEIALPEARDRPATLLNRVEFAFAYGLGAVFRLIGVDAASALSGKFTRLVGPMLTRISDRGLRNLEIAFPEMPEDERAAIIKDVWENLGRTTAEFAHLEKFDPNAAAARQVSGAGNSIRSYMAANRSYFSPATSPIGKSCRS
ncbi:MAG: hypothetical protein R3C60_13475 [Parvularculaceae bacterium]